MQQLFDLHGRKITLGRCLGRGGEGAVYAVPRQPRLAAKVYARRPDDQLLEKLGSMIAIGEESALETVAWPKGLLLDGPGGDVVGFLMQRVANHRPLHVLYSPRTRHGAFPRVRWDFLVRAARNLAAAVKSVHARGLVIGDVNEGNAVVSRRATVRLIDCDSFQVTRGGRVHLCPVGVPLFTPPELQGVRLDSVARTAEHDLFGLAALVFQLLFMGRHPYAGCHPTREITVEAAIREGFFAYGWDAARLGWQPPPLSLRLADIPSSMGSLFERAFGDSTAVGAPRPEAGEWVAALDRLESQLVTCGSDPAHRHARASGPCPWCRIEEQGGPIFFACGDANGRTEWRAAWRAIEAIRPPGPAVVPAPHSLPEIVGRPVPEEVLQERSWRRRATVAIVLPAVACYLITGTLVGLVLMIAFTRFHRVFPEAGEERERRKQALAACEGELRLLEDRFRSQGSDHAFQRKREELRAARRSVESGERGHEQVLRAGAVELRVLRHEILARRRELWPAVAALYRRRAQLKADLEQLVNALGGVRLPRLRRRRVP
jgi:DNA-binding helix-hairpin-helix protein with protein kinase domain